MSLEVSRSTIFRCIQGSYFLKFVKHQHIPSICNGGSQEDPKLDKGDDGFGEELGLIFSMKRN